MPVVVNLYCIAVGRELEILKEIDENELTSALEMARHINFGRAQLSINQSKDQSIKYLTGAQ